MQKKTFRRIASCVAAVAGSARALLQNRRGVAAVEFALIAPLLLALYFLTVEFSQAIDADKKVNRIASMTADLITQQTSTDKADVDAILQIGEAILQPYNRSAPTITATAIQISDDATPIATVDWSRKLSGNVSSTGPDAHGKRIDNVPANLMVKGSYLIRVQAQLTYLPIIAWTAEQKASLGLAAAFSSINMEETYYLRPRMSSTIECSDCNS